MGEIFGPPVPLFLIVQAEALKTGRSMSELAVEMAKTDEQRNAYLTWAAKARNPNAGLGSADWNTVFLGIIRVVPEDDYHAYEAWTRAGKGLSSLPRPERNSVTKTRQPRFNK